MTELRSFTYQTGCVGQRFYPGAVKAFEAATDETAFTLVREPGNEFDPNAIAVLLDGEKCGHIPAAQAKFLAPLLDKGVEDMQITRQGNSGLLLKFLVEDEGVEAKANASEKAANHA